MKSISGDSLSYEQLNKIVERSQSPYLDIFEQPFNNGLDEYGVNLFIHLKNIGEKSAKNVYIKLPSKGIVLIRDDSKNYKTIESKTGDINIPSIVQNGDSKVWVFFDASYEEVRNSTINIGHDDGLADISIYREYKGVNAFFAKYSDEVILILVLLFIMVVGLLSIGLFSESNYSSNKSSNSDGDKAAADS